MLKKFHFDIIFRFFFTLKKKFHGLKIICNFIKNKIFKKKGLKHKGTTFRIYNTLHPLVNLFSTLLKQITIKLNQLLVKGQKENSSLNIKKLVFFFKILI